MGRKPPRVYLSQMCVRETSTPPCKERIIVREHMSVEGPLVASLMTLFCVLFGALIYAYVSAMPINRPYPTYTPMATPIPATPTATPTLTSTPTATPTNTPSPSPTRARQYLYAVKVTAPLLNVRTCGNLACSIINSVPMGTVLFVLEESNGWLRVGEAAWVCVDYTQRLGEKHD